MAANRKTQEEMMLLKLIFAMMIGMSEKRPACQRQRARVGAHVEPLLARLGHALARPFFWGARGH